MKRRVLLQAPRLWLIGLLLLSVPACAAAVLVGAGAALGIWAYDEHNDDGGEISLGYSPERVYETALQLSKERGFEVMSNSGSMRIACEIDDNDVVFQVFVIPNQEGASRLKVTARDTFRGQPEFARELALEVQDRLGG